MTNLSELLPSGGGAKEFSTVASGTLANGQTVALKTDGKVEAVGISSEAVGTTQTWSGTAVAYNMRAVYDPDQQKVVIAYRSTSDYGYAIVGDVDPSNNSITFGAPVLWVSSFVIPQAIGYDTVNDKIAVFYQDVSSGSHGKSRVGTVSGNTITIDTAVGTYNAGSTEATEVVFNPDQGVFLVIYKDNASSGRPTGVVGTISGTSISFGSEASLDSNDTSYLSITYNTTTSSYVMVYNSNAVPQNIYYQVPTTSGTTVTAGTPTIITLNSSTTASGKYTTLSSDNASNTVFLTTVNSYNNNYASSIAATLSGSTLTFGTENVFYTSTTYELGSTYDIDAKKLVVSYSKQDGVVIPATVSGTTLTFGSPTTFRSSQTGNLINVYDSSHKRVFISYAENNTAYGGAVVYAAESTNASDFIGITSEAIANTATGKVNPQGGVATAQATGGATVGTATEFTGGIPATDLKGVFTSTSNKVVYAFQNAGTGYGNAIVSNINASTNAITFGSAVSYNAISTSYNNIGFDANAQRIVAIYASAGNSYAGDARVSSVSGTSLGGFGAVGTFTSGSDDYMSGDIVFDSNSNKMVIAFRRKDNSNNYYGSAVVGTVDSSNDTISFGSVTNFSNTDVSYVNATFDSNSNKVVIAYRDNSNNHGTAIVGTVSGTAISFPNSATVFNNANTEMNEGKTICFDSNSNKVVIPFLSSTGKAIVGTVSGNTINFNGTATAFSGGDNSSQSSTFDSTLNRVIVQWRDNFNNSYGTASSGTVSGDSITFDTAVIVSTNQAVTAGSNSAVYDSNSNRTSLAQRIGNPASSLVFIPSGVLEPLVTGSTYYVQNDGTLTTTSSTVTAGKAISTTQLVLKGAS